MLTLGQFAAGNVEHDIHYNICIGSDCNPILGCSQADIISQHKNDVVKTYAMNPNNKSGSVACVFTTSKFC